MKKETILQYGAGILFAIAVFVAGAFSQGLFEQTSAKEIYGCLSDCFLFPGVLLGGLGALTWIGGEGFFDVMSYGFAFVFNRLIHPRDAQESFYDYKMRKIDNRKPWLKHWFLIGLVCFALSVLFLLLYLA